MNIYIAIVTGDKPVENINNLDWHPWINCSESDKDIMPTMALNKFIRERGGLSEDEKELKVSVYRRTEMTLPCVAHVTQFKLTHKEKAS